MKFKKIAAFLLAAILIISMIPMSVQADDGWILSELKTDETGLDPIPLLIIKINYDADGDGKDAYISGVAPETAREMARPFMALTRSPQWAHAAFVPLTTN